MPINDGYAPYLKIPMSTDDLPIRIYGLPPDGVFDRDYEIDVELTYHPKVNYGALIQGVKFELVEGPKIVGYGQIL
jgi:hypothetical protein